MVQDCSSFLLERNESPKLISSEPKIPVLGRKRKIKENTVNENSTSIIEILGEFIKVLMMTIFNQKLRIIPLLQEIETIRKKEEIQI